MDNPGKYTVRAVVFPSGSHWVAQCLEYDIATQARTRDALLVELQRIVIAHIVVAKEEHIVPFSDIPKAPKRFWEMYRGAESREQLVAGRELQIPTPIDVAYPKAA